MHLEPISKTKYGNFEICPARAYLIHCLNLKEPPGPAAVLGSTFHAVQEQVTLGVISLSDALEQADDDLRYMLESAQNLLPYTEEDTVETEKHIYIDKKGTAIFDESKAIAHGFLDLVVHNPQKEKIIVADWKTGRWVKDNPFERNLYAGILAHAAFPQYPVVSFQLIFVRTGVVLESTYTFKKNLVEVTAPNNETTTYSGSKQPLLEWLTSILRRIRQSPPAPNPGAHCTKMFGKGCVFHKAECPLSEKLPVVASHLLSTHDRNRYADAIMTVLKLSELTAPKDIVADAYFAAQQLKSAVKYVESYAEDWTKHYNTTFSVGNDVYGWHKKERLVLDAPWILESLFNAGLPFDVIAKAVNISKTSLLKIRNKTAPGLINYLLEMGSTTESSNEKFGLVDTSEESEV